MLEKYTTSELKQKDEKEKDKIIISNDAYAICEHLNCLINKLRENR